MSSARVILRLLVVLFVATAITVAFADSIDPIQNPSGTGLVPETTSTTAPECRRGEVATATIVDSDPSRLSIAVSQLAFLCADTVVVASGTDPVLLAGAQLAAAAGGPLLVASQSTEAVSEEIGRLNAGVVYIVGDSLPRLPGGTEARSINIEEAIAETSRLLDGAPVLQATGPLSLARTIVAAQNGTAVLSGAFETNVAADATWAAEYAPTTATVWLADGSRPELVAPVLAAASTRNETVLLVDPIDLRTPQSTVSALRRIGPNATVVVGDFDPGLLEWQVPALTSAPELPGGGLVFYPGRRLVALYGNPTTSALGVLGEQSAEESVRRVREIALGYDADGVPILPTFEIIATVASASAGSDNDYSEEMSLDTLRPWIEVAQDNGVYVILDLQPGRTDFLTQAKRYEEFLRMPHVGLALDSEWRLEPDQVHLRQIGSVDATEINTVVEWLAALVRDQNLPQKYLLLHQFRLDMITNRHQVNTPPELAVVIQMDGQGPLPTKYDTWNALTAGTEDAGFTWGWKNFYDEDTPRGGATAEEVLDLDPVPGYVSFQ